MRDGVLFNSEVAIFKFEFTKTYSETMEVSENIPLA